MGGGSVKRAAARRDARSDSFAGASCRRTDATRHEAGKWGAGCQAGIILPLPRLEALDTVRLLADHLRNYLAQPREQLTGITGTIGSDLHYFTRPPREQDGTVPQWDR